MQDIPSPPILEAPTESPAPPPPLTDVMMAAAIFLTRLPLPFSRPMTPDLFGRAMGWFPLIGAGLGLGAGIAFALLGGFGLPPLLAAVLTVTLLIGVTGALHEDGLADVADGFGGGGDRERKLEIMRDSRLGVYGGLALVLSVALRVAALAALPSAWAAIKALTVAGALSRAAMVAVSHWLPPARTDGLSATLGGPAKGATVMALAIAIGVAFALLGFKSVLVLAVAGAATFAMLRLAAVHIGGQTGDVLGATQQVVEIVALVLLAGGR